MVIVQSFVIYYDLKFTGVEFAKGQTALKNPRPDSVIKTHKTVLKNQAMYFPYPWVAMISCLRLSTCVGAQADALTHRQV